MSGEKNDTQVPWQGLAALALVAIVTFFYLSPLDTSRPVERAGVPLSLERQQNVNARLWQDPLMAAYGREGQIRSLLQASKDEEFKKENARHDRCILTHKIKTEADSNGGLKILSVIVPGGAYAEYGETRLRQRRAVLEALGMNRFIPTNGEYLDYVQVPWPEDPCSRDTMIVPYEFCQPMFDESGADSARKFNGKILILWLRDEAFEGKLLASLINLHKSLGIDPTKEPVKVLGPRSSEGLRGLVGEVLQKDKEPILHVKELAGISIFSGTATASDELLLFDKVKKSEATTIEAFLGNRLQEPDFHFYRTTSTDDEVCKELIVELGRRGVCLPLQQAPKGYKHGSDDIALIAEWDTFYGRALPISFSSLLSPKPLNKGLEPPPETVHIFRYLRGIDGMLPEVLVKDAAVKRDPKELKNPLLPRETTEGLNQADYLRRLAAKLRDLDQQLLRDRNHGLKAVGVLGSDVYDKLMILKALRSALPGVLFFTNSLDARLGHPDEWNSARNLIIATPFGFDLGENWAKKPMRANQLGSILPFRDSYQTAIYATTLLATTDGVTLNPGFLKQMKGTPRLYEIARNGPYELPKGKPDIFGNSHFHPLQSLNWWNRKRGRLATLMICFVGSLVAWVYFVLIGKPAAFFRTKSDSRKANTKTTALEAPEVLEELARRERSRQGREQARQYRENARLERERLRQERNNYGQERKEDPKEKLRDSLERQQDLWEAEMDSKDKDQDKNPDQWKRKWPRISPWLALPMAFLFAWALVSFVLVPLQGPGGEPFEWLEGISIWPTEIIRITAILLATYYILNTHLTLENNKREIEEEFGLEPPLRPKRIIKLSRIIKWRNFSCSNSFSEMTDWMAQHVRRLTLVHWKIQHPDFPKKIDAQGLWNEYIWSGYFNRRVTRIIPLLLLYLLAALMLMLLLEFPFVPYRGNYSHTADIVVLVLLVLVATFLTFYVADATILNRRLIKYITINRDTEWPCKSYELYRERLRLTSTAETEVPRNSLLCDYLEIELIARRTEVVSGLIYYPFNIATLAIISRLSIFDNWGWPLSLLLVMIFNTGYAAWSAFRLRTSAEEARERTLQRLSEILVASTATGDDTGTDAKLVRLISSEIQAESRGAFAAISHHPIFGAILLPSGGLGLWALSQYLPKLFE